MTEENRQGVFPKAFRAIDTAIASAVQATVAAAPSLIAEVDRFHTIRGKTLGILGELSGEQAVWSPRAGAWSITQIADHLLRSDELFRGYFRRLIQNSGEGKTETIRISLSEVDASLAGIPREVMRVFEAPARLFSMFVPHAVREKMIRHAIVPASNPTVTEPRPGVTLEQVRTGLSASMAETERVLRAPMPADVESATIDHPIMGNNNLLQWLRITNAHEERHHGQISDLRAHADFPKLR